MGYLWSDEDTAIGGSEGYYVEVYEEYILLKGREYTKGEWCAAAQFLIPLNGGDSPIFNNGQGTDPTSEPTVPTSGTTEPTLVTTDPAPTETESTATTVIKTDSPKTNDTSCAPAFLAIAIAAAGTVLATQKKRIHKNG